LFWYGWSARESIHWIMPIIGSGFFTVGIITLFNPVINYLGIAYPTYAASIFAGNALFRASFGAAFPLFVSCT
jgi:DHA1 family multidrug resistance protein-like MFS transporter